MKKSIPMKRIELDEELVIERYLMGEAALTIAKSVKVDVGTILSRLRKYGVPIRSDAGRFEVGHHGKGAPRLNLDTEDLKRRYSHGDNLQKIAADLGVGLSTVWRYLKAVQPNLRKGSGYDPVDENDQGRICLGCYERKPVVEFPLGKSWRRCCRCRTSYEQQARLDIESAVILLLQTEIGDKCAICDTTEEPHGSNLSLDHNHKTGEVRGFLCIRCNFLIGYIEHRKPRHLHGPVLDRARAYLANPPARTILTALKNASP